MPIANELTINTSASALDMANAIFGDGITVTSASFQGDAVQSGIYSGALSTIAGIVPTDTGVILSTGNVTDFTTSSGTTDTNTVAGLTSDPLGGIDGDAQLNAVAGMATFDGAILNASFIPTGDMLTMQFVFSSEEYPEYVNGGVNDAFGVWINGNFVPATISVAGNISIDSVNGGVNQNLYRDNTADQFNTEMDGFTYVLSFKAPVTAGQVNTIKIGIADGGDSAFDSNLLIMGNSIQTFALAMDDTIQLTANSIRTFDILANDRDETDAGLTITQINGTAVVAGQVVTLPTGEQVRLNADGTVTVFSDGDLGTNTLSYTVLDTQGNTDVGFIFIETVAVTGPDGIVQGTAGNDVIQVGYLGDPDGDRIDNNDGQGVGGTTADADYVLAGAGNDSITANLGNDIIYAGTGDDTAFGGVGTDWVASGEGNDSVDGGAGNDTIYGDGGNDNLSGGNDNDLIFGGAGRDNLFGGFNDDTLYGGEGHDSLFGGGQVDLLYGGNGNDTLDGGDNTDTVYGGAGDDLIVDLGGSLSDDFLYGGDGNDTISGGDREDLISGDAGNDQLAGDAGDDTLFGGADADTITIGLAQGTDSVQGGETGIDFDTLSLTAASNVSITLTGNEAGVASYAGGGGATFSQIERIVTGAGNDFISAVSDATGLVVETGAGNDTIVGGSGNDTVYGGDGNETLNGGAGNDALYGGGDNDVFFVTAGFGQDTVIGGQSGTNYDTLDLSGLTNPVTVVFTAPGAGVVTDTVTGHTVTFSEIEQLILTQQADVVDASLNHGYTYIQSLGGNDQITGSAGSDIFDDEMLAPNGQGNDTFYGCGGNDVLWMGIDNDLAFGGTGDDSLGGEEGDDVLYGDAGNDSLNGHSGNDTLYGGTGDDLNNGGDGADTFVYARGEGVDTIIGGEGGTDLDTLQLVDATFGGTGATITYTTAEAGSFSFNLGSGTFSEIEVVRGSASGDAFLGGAATTGIEAYAEGGFDFMQGGSGNDSLYGGTGGDSMLGGTGADLLYGDDDSDTLRGDAGNDTLFGGQGNDSLIGGGDNDQLFGGYGRDTLLGGIGNDSLFGGDGRDTFFTGDVTAAVGNDVVDGGEGGDDYDVLDLTAWSHPATNIIYDVNNPENGIVEFLDANGAVIGTMTFSNIESVVACFTMGAQILTDQGELAVEDLQPGHRVLTRDNGYQPIRWTGRRDLSHAELIVEPRFNPVHIARGALGAGLPVRDIMVSPQHRMLVTGPRAELLFGENEVLVAAKHLVGLPGIEQRVSRGVSYLHILFDQHEIVRADGAWSESFQPGDLTMEALQGEQRAEITALFPELGQGVQFQSARLTLTAREARALTKA